MSTSKLTKTQQQAKRIAELEAQIAATEANHGNLQAVITYTDDDGEVVEAATLRIASLTYIKSGLGKRLAGILNVHSEAVYANEDDSEKGMSEADAVEHLNKALNVTISRCKTRFEEKPEVVDKWADAAPSYEPRKGSAKASGGFTRVTMPVS